TSFFPAWGVANRSSYPRAAGRSSTRKTGPGRMPGRCVTGVTLLEVEEASKLFRAGWMAQLSQRLGLYLANALAGDVELLADLFKGVVGVHVDAEAHAQHLGLARSQPREHLLHRVGQAGGGGGVDRREDVGVFDEVT